MQDALFSGLFGALTAEHRMTYIANNLANVNTSGYKRDALAFSDTMAYYAHDEIREPLMNVRSKGIFPEQKNVARPRLAANKIDFAQGAMKVTGDPLDVAISGENAFFRVETPNGTYLTRDGHFVLSNDGTIMTPQGYAVQGDGGAIQIPPRTRTINISGDGQVLADGELIGRISLVSVDNLAKVQKLGQNLYKAKENVDVTEGNAYASGARLEQGFIEAANVEVVTEMVSMIETNRQFEAYQKVMQTADSLDRAANERIGKRIG
ncbi:MAG: flagellar basal-body rod protein FlgF [Desulfovibrionaceae bacterium]|nr:flagellar basal-body rod protein FlgF [Desulfovibrionaceae bacterium]